MTPCNECVQKISKTKMILASSSIEYYDIGGLCFQLYDMIQLESFAAALLRG